MNERYDNNFGGDFQSAQGAWSEPAQPPQNPNGFTDALMARVRSLIQKGNVTRIIVRRKNKILLNISLNTGIVGGLVGVAAAPWALVVAAVAAAGMDCRIELVRDDGNIIEVSSTVTKTARDIGRTVEDKARDLGGVARGFGDAVAEGIRSAIDGEGAAKAGFESVVEQAEAEAAPPEDPADPTHNIPIQ